MGQIFEVPFCFYGNTVKSLPEHNIIYISMINAWILEVDMAKRI